MKLRVKVTHDSVESSESTENDGMLCAKSEACEVGS